MSGVAPGSTRSLKRTATVEELLRSARDDADKQFAAGEDAARRRADALRRELTRTPT